MFKDRERGRGREKHQCEVKHRLVASRMCLNWGSNPQSRFVPWPGIKPANFGCKERCSNQLSHPARARGSLLGVPFWALCAGLSLQIFLTYRCLYDNWGFDILPQGVAKVIADVVRDFNIRLEWKNEPFLFFFNYEGLRRKLWWRQSFLSIDVCIVFRLFKMRSQ